MLWFRKRRTAICAECKYLTGSREGEGERKENRTSHWECKAHSCRKAYTNPLTGEAVPADYDYCWCVNGRGQCRRFKPADKET